MTENPIDVPQSSLELVIAYAGNSIEVHREEEAYSLLSLVADVGGVLGLFIGFNFLIVLDWIMCGVDKFWRRTILCA